MKKSLERDICKPGVAGSEVEGAPLDHMLVIYIFRHGVAGSEVEGAPLVHMLIVMLETAIPGEGYACATCVGHVKT